jgi:glycosyltransferase involved in cell wall biosynthesis
MMEDHTFVIPVYKESPYLEACIQSLIGQSIKSNVVLVTSTPTGFSKDLASQYGLPYIINDTTETDPITNWNFALSVTGTKLVTIAHQDDTYEKKFAEKVVSAITKYDRGNLLIAFTNYTDTIDDVPRNGSLNALVKKVLLWPFFFSKSIKSIFFKKLILKFGNPICCPSVTFNMELLYDFRFKRQFNTIFDWHAWFELAGCRGSFIYLDEKLVMRRLHSASGTTELINSGEKIRDEQQMFEIMWGKGIARFLIWLYKLSYKDNLL